MTKKINYKSLKKTKKIKNFPQTGGSDFDLTLLTTIYPSATFKPESYLEAGITENLSNFDKIPNSNVCLIKIHGSYFDSRTPDSLYFPVPDNVIICNLTEFTAYSLDNPYQFNITKQKPEFFQDLFLNKARLSNYNICGSEKFSFRNFFVENKIIKSHISHDLFYNSSWYYPGQFCHNVGLSCNKTEIKRLNLVITDVEFESDDSDYKRPSFTKNTCNITEKTMGGKDFETNLQNICETLKVNGRKNIVIMSNCMELDIGILLQKSLELEQIRKYDNQLAKFNRELDIYRGKFKITKYPDYYMVNKSATIFDIQNQKTLIDIFLLDKDNSIKDYHKIYRVLEIIKEKLHGKGPKPVKLENKYIELLQNLSFNRLHDAFQIIIPGFTETEPKYKNLISQILTDEYLERCYNSYMFSLIYLMIHKKLKVFTPIYKYMIEQIRNFGELNLLTNLNPTHSQALTYIQNSLSATEENTIIYLNDRVPTVQASDGSKQFKKCIIQGNIKKNWSEDKIPLSEIEYLKICDNDNLTRDFLKKFHISSFKKNYQVRILNSKIDSDIIFSEFKRMNALFLDNCSFINNQNIEIATLFNRFILATHLDITHTNIINLDLRELKIKSIKIKDCSELTQIEMNIVDNLEHLELVNLPKLGNLNGIIGLIKTKKLLSLHISNFQITAKDIQELNQVSVKELSMSHIVLNDQWRFNNTHIEKLILDDFTGSNKINFSEINLSFKLNLLQLSNLDYTLEGELMELSEWYRQLGIVVLENTNSDFNQFVDEDDFGARRG